MADPKDRSRDVPKELRRRIDASFDGGQPKPRTPSGEVKPWKPPEKETTPSNRKK